MPTPRILEGPEAIAEGVRTLASGQVVAFPTETVYGLAADATNPAAIKQVFKLKGRPSHNPLIVHVADIDMAKTVAADWSDAAQRLADQHWPGPLTLVVPKAETVPPIVTADGPTVAVRCPDHPIALALIDAFGNPIVGPSANTSGRVSPTTADHVASGFQTTDLIIIDGGPCRAGIESTVLDLTAGQPTILRPGILGPENLTQTLGMPVHTTLSDSPLGNAKSPGILGPHYQPTTPVSLVEIAPTKLPPKSVLISHTKPQTVGVISIPSDLPGYAASIYAALHQADAFGADRIIVETPCHTGNSNDIHLREAIMERLSRAAS